MLDNLDKLNPKALFRRVHAYKKLGKYSEAVRDYETLVNKTTEGKQFTKDLAECKKLLEDQQIKQAKELKSNKI